MKTATLNPLIAAFTCDRVIVSCSINAAANRITFLVNDAFVFETKYNDAEIAQVADTASFCFWATRGDQPDRSRVAP